MKIQRELILKITIVCLLSILMSACATNRERFPEYGEVAKNNKNIPIVLDLFVYRDIAGKSRGVDSELTKRSIDTAQSTLVEKLGELGYEAKILTVLNGLTHDFKADRDYQITEGWKSTEESYTHIELDESVNPWHTEENRNFLHALKSTARKINARANVDQSKAEEKLVEERKGKPEEKVLLLSEQTIPSMIAQDPESDIIMFVLIDGYFQSTGKYLGQSLLIGGLSAALTGGTLVTTGSGTQLNTDIIVYEKKSQKVLWHGNVIGSAKNAVRYAIEGILNSYPDSEGLTRWDRKRYRKPKDSAD